MKFWSNDLQCFRNYQKEHGGVGLFDEHEMPYNWSSPGEEYDDVLSIYGSQVHLQTRPLTEEEFWKLRSIDSMFDADGDWPEEGDAWDMESGRHSYWLNFDYFSLAARRYLESLPD